MSLTSELFEIRSRSDFSANDITLWCIRLFEQTYGIKPSQEVKTEVYIREEDVSGRADVVVQESIGIETKSNLVDERDKALDQIQNILTKLKREGNTSPVGIATDGKRWEFFVLVGQNPFQFHEFEIIPNGDDEFLVNNLENGLTALRRETGRPNPTAEAIAEKFRPHGPAFNEIYTQLDSALEEVIESDPIEFRSKFVPWYELFSYVYNNFEEQCQSMAVENRHHSQAIEQYRDWSETPEDVSDKTLNGAIELWLRHTYLALIAKSLSALVTLGEEGTSSAMLDSPEKIVTGEIVRDNGVSISDSNDFFVWARASGNCDSIVSSILKPLRQFSDDYSDDVFRHLYEIVVDEQTRHELGEFFTPKWMAQLMCEDSITSSTDSVIDPACGSGTFLVFALITKLGLASDQDLTTEGVANLIDDVQGIDVNPLSVVLSRTNMYLTIVSELPPELHPAEIEPKVFNADTFILPRFNEEQRQLTRENKTSSLVSVPVTPELNIPVLPQMSPHETIDIIEECGKMMESGLSEVPDEADRGGNIGEYKRAILQKMNDLRAMYGDNLWKFVLKNYGVPPLLQGEFDVVLGNPPWLSFREAKSSLKDVMEYTAEDYSIKPPAAAKTSFNLCVPFFMTSTGFLKPDGVISFVLPMSILDSPAHVPFIQLVSDNPPFKIEHIYDLEDISPYPFPHALPAAILIVSKGDLS